MPRDKKLKRIDLLSSRSYFSASFQSPVTSRQAPWLGASPWRRGAVAVVDGRLLATWASREPPGRGGWKAADAVFTFAMRQRWRLPSAKNENNLSLQIFCELQGLEFFPPRLVIF